MDALSLIQDEQEYALALADRRDIEEELAKLIAKYRLLGIEPDRIAHVEAEIRNMQPLYRAWNRLDFYARTEGIHIVLPCWMKEA